MKIWSVIAMCASVILTLAGCDRMDIIEKHYLAYSDLAVDNEPGNWIPKFIPGSASDIRLSAKIDTGEQLLSFSFSGNFRSESCVLADISREKYPPQGFLLIKKWWPHELVRENLKKPDFLFYSCEDGYNMAIHREDMNRAFVFKILEGR